MMNDDKLSKGRVTKTQRTKFIASRLQSRGLYLFETLGIPKSIHRRLTALAYVVLRPIFIGTPHYVQWQERKKNKVGEATVKLQKRRKVDQKRSHSQKMEEYLLERYGHDCCRYIQELIAIINRSNNNPLSYGKSLEFHGLYCKVKQNTKINSHVDVSIVIPVHNNPILILTCLEALYHQTTRLSYEVLIGDDASSDSTHAMLSKIGGRVRYFRHQSNIGFLQNCNRVARKARGDYLVILNNDTLPLPGWLDELIQPFFDTPRVGLTGSKLLNTDGTLQEAGGIIWRDGSAWNFGRNRDPRLPEFNYVKEVDYCSGASIAIPKKLWNELGGFDPAFAPAYCEDSDLAFRIRRCGYSVVYQPYSELIHHEGCSHGRDVSSGLKAYQKQNQKKLFQRWSKVLRQHAPNGQHVYVARDRSASTPHILFIDHYVPQFDRDAGSRTIWSYMRVFRDAGFRVTFWPHNRHRGPVYTDKLQRLGIEVLYSAGHGRSFESWFAEVGTWIKYVFVSRPDVSNKYVDLVRRHSSAKILFYGHDLHWLRLQREFELFQREELLRQSQTLKQLEQSVCARSDVVFYPSAEECALVRQEFARDHVYELPAYCFSENDLRRAQKTLRGAYQRDPHHLLFIGGFSHRPNEDGVLWFTQKIFPYLRSKSEQFRFTIVGSNIPEQVRALASDRISVMGQVNDDELRRLYSKVGVSVIPIRFGSGVKGKVIEAFANGVPVVSTTVGMQGIDEYSELAFVADEPGEFVEQLWWASTDRRMARRKAQSAIDFVRRKYSVEAIREVLSSEVSEFRRDV